MIIRDFRIGKLTPRVNIGKRGRDLRHLTKLSPRESHVAFEPIPRLAATLPRELTRRIQLIDDSDLVHYWLDPWPMRLQ